MIFLFFLFLCYEFLLLILGIKTRLGIHDGVLENCSDTGLLILELVGKEKDNKEIARKVALIRGVSSKLVELSLPNE